VYVHVFGVPKGPLTVSLAGVRVRSARCLRDGKPVPWRVEEGRLVLDLAPERCAPSVTVVALDTDGIPDTRPSVRRDPDGTLVLPAGAATTHGVQLCYQAQYDDLGCWMTPTDWAEWTFDVPEAGDYRIVLEGGVSPGQEGSSMALRVAGREFRFTTRATSGWTDYRRFAVGAVRLPKGRARMALRCLSMPAQAVLNVKAIRLEPSEGAGR
jgi:hypothetical protein